MTRAIKFFQLLTLTTAAALVIATTQDLDHGESDAPIVIRTTF